MLRVVAILDPTIVNVTAPPPLAISGVTNDPNDLLTQLVTTVQPGVRGGNICAGPNPPVPCANAANNAIVSQQPKMVGPQPLKWWEKAGMVLACIAGMDPEFAAPIGLGSPQPIDSTDSTNTTEGQGPPLGPNKGGGLVPYGGSPEVPSGAAGGAAYGAGVGQCITNVFTAWPK
ncbi:MAG TPA: hypothetical protein VGG14_03270 [Candidatus Sulfotelmatobacter sp.]|jgi:hypothetical protein